MIHSTDHVGKQKRTNELIQEESVPKLTPERRNAITSFWIERESEFTTEIKTKKKRKITHHHPDLLSTLFIKGLLILRRQHPLVCLQHYLLNNANLKRTWEIFRENGCFSIVDLVEKRLVNSSDDLLKLEEIAKKEFSNGVMEEEIEEEEI